MKIKIPICLFLFASYGCSLDEIDGKEVRAQEFYANALDLNEQEKCNKSGFLYDITRKDCSQLKLATYACSEDGIRQMLKQNDDIGATMALAGLAELLMDGFKPAQCGSRHHEPSSAVAHALIFHRTRLEGTQAQASARAMALIQWRTGTLAAELDDVIWGDPFSSVPSSPEERNTPEPKVEPFPPVGEVRAEPSAASELTTLASTADIPFQVGPFSATYFKDGVAVVENQAVADVAVRYIYSEFQGIPSNFFSGKWTGPVVVSNGPKHLKFAFSASWSSVSFKLGTLLDESWQNDNKTFDVLVPVGTHEIVIDYENNWHTTGFKLTISDVPSISVEEARQEFSDQLTRSGLKILSVGAYEPRQFDSKITVDLANLSGPIFLVASSYEPAHWTLLNTTNVEIVGVVTASYSGQSEVSGAGTSARILDLKNKWGYEPADLATLTREVTGLDPTWIESAYNPETLAP